MATTFLFADSLTEKGCVCLVIDSNHHIVQACAERSFDAIRQMQSGTETVVVLSARQFTFHSVQLPWLGDKKARAALPFALEDQLAQHVDELHFAFDRQHYSDGRYLVVVSDKKALEALIRRLQDEAITWTTLTVDWFALQAKESCVLADYWLMRNDTFSGAITADLRALVPPSDDQTIYTFTDSPTDQQPDRAINTALSARQWLAQRLVQTTPLDLCQGPLAHGSAKASLRHWLIAAAAMMGIWVISLIVVNGLKLHELTGRITATDSQIAVLYRQFFPEAQQVISPRFRITQYLKNNQSKADQQFWVLLDKLAAAATSEVTIDQLRFQNNVVQVTLSTPDFASLETLQNRLQSNRVVVKQNQASTVEGRVVSTLELTL